MLWLLIKGIPTQAPAEDDSARVPRTAAAMLVIVAALIYFVSPYDAIPDSVPILGQIDDAVVVRFALKTVAAACSALRPD